MAVGIVTAPVRVAMRLVRHRRLVYELSKRELLDRYAGQLLGIAWAVIQPLTMVLVFLFMFDVVLKVRVTTGTDAPRDFATYLIAGLGPWLVLQEVLARGPTLIVGQAHLVKQVAFPLEVLAVRVAPPAFVTLLVGFAFLAVKQISVEGGLAATWWTVPYLTALLVLNCVGFALLLGALGVFVRDMKDIVQFLLFVALYISPIFYAAENVPGVLKTAIYANPFTPMILCFQDAIFYGAIVHPWAWYAYSAISLGVYAVGARVFTATQAHFGSYV